MPVSKTINKQWARSVFLPVIGEVVSTALLMLLGCMGCAPVSSAVSLGPFQGAISFGITVMFNIQIFGHVSGAHMNPAVTIGAALLNQIPLLLAALYVVAQCAGATLGYWLLTLILPATSIRAANSTVGLCTTVIHSDLTNLQAFLIEFAVTAILIWVNCALCWDAVNQKQKENVSIKFGIVVLGLSIIAGGFTSASMNPARSLGPAIVNNNWEKHWVYWVGPLSSSVICTLIYRFAFLTEQKRANNEAEMKPLDEKEMNRVI